MSGNHTRQWPDNITSGEIRYEPSGVYEGGFILRDADHGIPVFGSVSAQVFNYPGQTEDIAKALCDRWNSYASSQAEIERLRAAHLSIGELPSGMVGKIISEIVSWGDQCAGGSGREIIPSGPNAGKPYGHTYYEAAAALSALFEDARSALSGSKE